jgi:diguanylate cyclase (GGDEF)-like protein
MYDPLIVDTFVLVHERLFSEATPAPVSARPGLAAITEAASSRFDFDDSAPSHQLPRGTEILTIYELGRSLANQDLPARDVAAVVGQHLQKLVDARLYAFFLCDHTANELATAYAVGDDATLVTDLRIPYGQRLSGWVAVNRGTIINSDPVLDLGDCARKVQPPLSNSLSVALTAAGELVGVLSLYSDRKFTQDDARVVEVVARQLGPAFRVAVESDRRRSLFTDSVTGLPSADYVRDLLGSEISASIRGEQALSLLLIDVNGFKAVTVGFSGIRDDTFLVKLSNAIKLNLRSTDVLFRFAGDEFVVALPQTDLTTARRVSARITNTFRTDSELTSAGVAVGVATAPVDGGTLEELLVTARSRLQGRLPSADAGSGRWT